MPSVATADAGSQVPAGYRVLTRQTLSPGVEHLELRRDDVPTDVHVARISAAARPRLRAVLAGDTLTGPGSGLDTTSSMCARYDCVVGVNGDFIDVDGSPVGAMIASSELVRSPGIPNTQLQLDARGRPSIDDFGWSADVRTVDGTRVNVDVVNRPLGADGVGLYSSRWGRATTDAHTVELVLAVTGASAARPLPRGASIATMVAVRPGGGPIAPGTVVLAGRGSGATALRALWGHRGLGNAATLAVSTKGAVQSIGGSPRMLIRGAPAWPTGDRSAFVRSPFPRTMVGATGSGELLLVTVDGRQPGYSMGVSLADATDILLGLGAVEGVNLDGGGSTAFTVGGVTANRPSGGGERRVTSALVVTRGGTATPAAHTEAAARPGPAPLGDAASVAPGLGRWKASPPKR